LNVRSSGDALGGGEWSSLDGLGTTFSEIAFRKTKMNLCQEKIQKMATKKEKDALADNQNM
jgi:hypothetical protein